MRRAALITIFSLLLAGQASAETYEIDPDHSSVGFKIRHLAISRVPGKFTQFKGTFSFDPKNIEASKAEAVIEAKSVDTEHAKRDAHLRDPDFFDAAKFPELKFTTTKIEPVSETDFKAHGELTIKDVTKPVVLNIAYLGSVTDPWGKQRAGFSATGKISRKEFGIVWNKPLETGGLVLGDEVDIQIDVEGIKKS